MRNFDYAKTDSTPMDPFSGAACPLLPAFARKRVASDAAKWVT
jgi:hypothetical protein